jgi:hypothetical protein
MVSLAGVEDASSSATLGSVGMVPDVERSNNGRLRGCLSLTMMAGLAW